jgi:hypothetical protein
MRLPVPKKKSFEIELEEGTINVTFRQAQNADELELSALFAERREIFDTSEPTKTTFVSQQNLAILRATEVRLTMDSCDIQNRKGRKLFSSGMSEPEFLKAWGQLPTEWADEIYNRCLFMNPQWGTSPYKEEEEEGEAEGESQEETASEDSST